MANVNIKASKGSLIVNEVVVGYYQKASGGGYIGFFMVDNNKQYIGGRYPQVFKRLKNLCEYFGISLRLNNPYQLGAAEIVHEAAEISEIEAAEADGVAAEQVAAETKEAYISISLDGVQQHGGHLAAITDSPADFAAAIRDYNVNDVVFDASHRALYVKEIFETVGFKSPNGDCELWAMTPQDVQIPWLSIALLSRPKPSFSRDWAEDAADNYDEDYERDHVYFH